MVLLELPYSDARTDDKRADPHFIISSCGFTNHAEKPSNYDLFQVPTYLSLRLSQQIPLQSYHTKLLIRWAVFSSGSVMAGIWVLEENNPNWFWHNKISRYSGRSPLTPWTACTLWTYFSSQAGPWSSVITIRTILFVAGNSRTTANKIVFRLL